MFSKCKSAVLIDTGKILAKRNLSVLYYFWLFWRLNDKFYFFCALLPNINMHRIKKRGSNSKKKDLCHAEAISPQVILKAFFM